MLKGLFDRFKSQVYALNIYMDDLTSRGDRDKITMIQEKKRVLNDYQTKIAEFSSSCATWNSGKKIINFDTMTNNELNTQTQEELKKHDGKFDIIIDVAKEIKYAGLKIRDENKVHEELLDNFDKEVMLILIIIDY